MKSNLLTFLSCLFFYQSASAQTLDDTAVLPYWKYYNRQPGALYRHLCEQAFVQLGERKKAVEALKSPGDWQKRQALVRRKLQEAIGTFPEKTPLNAVVTGKIERDGIVVEKLYFESIPGYYVTAALFMPADRKEKLPAILFCSGHGAPAYRSGGYQQMILNYARKGFAVLAFDPIGQGERIQYVKSDDRRFSALKPTLEHSYPGAQSFITGLSPAMYFIWDGIRAVDYLLARPEIDGTRIGVTGRSGGGTQSAYIAAMDPRIRAAAPECYLTTYDKLLRSNGPQDAEQILTGMLSKGLDLSDLVEVRAPRPLLMVTTTRDMFSIEGARNLFAEAKRAYKALGAEANLDKTEDDAGHASTPKNREATYAFFQKHLLNPGPAADEKIPPFTAEELSVTPTGNVFSFLGGESLWSLTQKRASHLAPGNIGLQKNINKQVVNLTGFVTPTQGEVIFSGKFQRGGYEMERFLVKGPGDYYLPVLWFKSPQPATKTLLYIDSKGKAENAGKGGIAEQLVKAGYDVVLPDLSGSGELANVALPGGDSQIDSASLNLWFMGIMVQKSLVAVRMEEIWLLTDFIKKRGNSSPITAVGVGTFVPDVLHAALVTPAIDRLALLNGLATYRSLIEQEQYLPRYIPSIVAGAINTYDLPDLAAALSPRKVWLSGMVDGGGQLLAGSDMTEYYSSKGSHIRMTGKPENVGVWLMDLLEKN